MIGIIGAMEMEIAGLVSALEAPETAVCCGQRFTSGRLGGVPVVVAKCGAGKVNAAMCAAAMLLRYAPSLVVSTGVAGGIGPGVKIGDLVVASHAVQYDYDTTAIGEPKAYVNVAGTEMTELPTSEKHNGILAQYAADI